MEKLYNRFKILSITTFILIILSITWIILDFYVIKDVLRDESLFSSWELLILKISLAVFVVLILSMLITIFLGFRIGSKGIVLSKKVTPDIQQEQIPELPEPEKE